MKRLALAFLALVLLRADMYPDASNAKLPGARTNLGAGKPVSIFDHGAKADAVTQPDAIMAAGSNILTSARANFTQGDIGKKIQVDGGAGVWLPPLRTTIAAVTDTHTVTLAAPATTATPRRWLTAAFVANRRTAGNYLPGDFLTVQGGTFAAAAVLKVVSTTVTATSGAAGGTGGVNGPCRIQGTTGSGTMFQQDVTISGGAITALGALSGGHYFANPASLAAAPVGNAPGNNCVPTGATLNLTMGVDQVAVTVKGDYDPVAIPADPFTTAAGSISGATGATFTSGGLPYGTFQPTGAFVYGSDDSQALTNAINAALTRFYWDSKPAYVFMPAGNYLIDSVTTPLMWTGLGIIGEGTYKTNIYLGANYVGDLFSWSEAWGGTGAPYGGLGGTMAVVNTYTGPKAIGFAVFGTRAAGTQQNALMFYDRVDQVLVDDVDITNITGHCMKSGMTKTVSQASMRESQISRMRCFSAGSTGVPAMEFASEGAGDATDEIHINDLNIYANYGDGLVFRSNTMGMRGIRINKLRIEGLQAADIGADLLRIGDPANTGSIFTLYINQLELGTPYPNKAAFRITGPADIYSIKVESGYIGSGAPMGYGLVLEAGRSLDFYFSQIVTQNTNVVTTSGAGAAIVLDGGGGEAGWTYSLVNPLALSSPFRRVSSAYPGGTMVVSCVGVPSGTLWNDAGTVKVCP